MSGRSPTLPVEELLRQPYLLPGRSPTFEELRQTEFCTGQHRATSTGSDETASPHSRSLNGYNNHQRHRQHAGQGKEQRQSREDESTKSPLKTRLPGHLQTLQQGQRPNTPDSPARAATKHHHISDLR
ncbi:hypothetical protein BGX38DRAFT_1274795 [Terfezia claveryi]|nr:hypothetical protein BGX38DRAFT_1274795 [Terfezia claveryi]